MKVILDTHVFLWWNIDEPQLSRLAREIIAEGRNELFLSAASTWEIALKAGKGRLILPEQPATYVPSRMRIHRIQGLPIQLSHTLQVLALPNIHNDPFDRLLVAQSQMEGIPILSADAQIAQYNIEVIW